MVIGTIEQKSGKNIARIFIGMHKIGVQCIIMIPLLVGRNVPTIDTTGCAIHKHDAQELHKKHKEEDRIAKIQCKSVRKIKERRKKLIQL